MKFYSSWKSKNKKWNKASVKVRIGAITIFDFYIDGANRMIGIIIMNFGTRFKFRKQ